MTVLGARARVARALGCVDPVAISNPRFVWHPGTRLYARVRVFCASSPTRVPIALALVPQTHFPVSQLGNARHVVVQQEVSPREDCTKDKDPTH